MRTRYLHAYTQCILALPVLETRGPLGVEGDLSGLPFGLLPVDCVVTVTVSMTVVGVVPNRATKRDQDYMSLSGARM